MQADLGSRLRYADADALLAAFMADPSTQTGAAALDLKYPSTVADAFLTVALTKGRLSPFKTDEEKARDASFKGSPDELEEAAHVMSPVFSGLYS